MVSHGLRFGECALAEPRAGVDVQRRPTCGRAFAVPVAMQSLRCGDGPGASSDRCSRSMRCSRRRSTAGAARRRTAPARSGPERAAPRPRRAGSASTATCAARAAAHARIGGRPGSMRSTPGGCGWPAITDVARSAASWRSTATSRAAALTMARGQPGRHRRRRCAPRQGTPFGPIGAALAEALIRAGRGGVRWSGRICGCVSRQRPRRGPASASCPSPAAAAPGWSRTGGDGDRPMTGRSGALSLDGDFALSGGGFPEAHRSPASRDRAAPMRGRRADRADGGRRGPARAAARSASPPRRAAGPASGPLSLARRPGRRRPGRRPGAAARGPVRPRRASPSARAASPPRSARSRSRGCGSARPGCRSARPGPPSSGRRRGGPLRAGAELREPRFAGRLGQSPIQLASSRLRFDLDGFSTVGPRRPARRRRRRSTGSTSAACQRPLRVGRRRRRLFGAVGQARQRRRCWSARARAAGRCGGGNVLMEGGIRVADEMRSGRASIRWSATISGSPWSTTASTPPAGSSIRRAAPASPQATIDHRSAHRRGRGGARRSRARLHRRLPARRADPAHRSASSRWSTARSRGQGRIEWDAGGSRSTGTFSTADMDLAAPFGPVEGLTTTIHFTDLLGLTSAPGQVARNGPRPRRHRRL